MIPFPDKKYNVIYADPPWQYKLFNGTGNGPAAKHYRTMKPEDIFNLPVQDIAADDCLLFLWVTFPNLEIGLETIKRWGFKYKTAAFVWVKRNKKSPGWFWGLGSWTRANAEVCLLATKGHPKRASKSVHSVIDEPIARHRFQYNPQRETGNRTRTNRRTCGGGYYDRAIRKKEGARMGRMGRRSGRWRP
mgnify:CR=1 FL=1